jgi:hypothetical protein
VATKDLFQVVKLDSKQAGPVELEMAKLRAEQKAFTARKGKGPAGVSGQEIGQVRGLLDRLLMLFLTPSLPSDGRSTGVIRLSLRLGRLRALLIHPSQRAAPSRSRSR